MSTLRPARGRGPVSRVAAGALAAGLVVAASMAAAPAADWDFDPVVDFSVISADNVQVATAQNEQSDTIYRLSVNLQLTSRTPRSGFSLSYQPSRDVYSDFGDLDNTSHVLRLSYNNDTSERTSWRARLNGSLYETPQLLVDEVTEEFVAAPRNETLRLAAGVRGTFDVSRRSAVYVDGEFISIDYENRVLVGADLDGDGTGDVMPPLIVEDADSFSIETGWQQELARDSEFRVSYRGSVIDEGLRGDTDVNRILAAWRKGRPDRAMVELRAGAARAKRNDAPAGIDDTSTDVVGAATLTMRVGREGALLLGATRDVQGTAGTSGAAIGDSYYGTLGVPVGRYSGLSFFARYSDRDPISGDPGLAKTKTGSYGVDFSAALSPKWLLQFGVRKLDQESEVLGDPREANYTTVQGGVRWAPTAVRR